jgi:hypothetical protein
MSASLPARYLVGWLLFEATTVNHAAAAAPGRITAIDTH